MTFCGITTDTGLTWRDFTPVLPGIGWKKTIMLSPNTTPEIYNNSKLDYQNSKIDYDKHNTLCFNTFNNKTYEPDPLLLIRFKCLLVAIITPTHHLYTGLKRMTMAAARVFSGYHLWKPTDSNEHIVKDIYEIVSTPLYIVGITVSALLGIIFPLYGRLLVGSLETLWLVSTGQVEERHMGLGDKEWAPCFQPHRSTLITKNQWERINDVQNSAETSNERTSLVNDNDRAHGLSTFTEKYFGFSAYIFGYKI